MPQMFDRFLQACQQKLSHPCKYFLGLNFLYKRGGFQVFVSFRMSFDRLSILSFFLLHWGHQIRLEEAAAVWHGNLPGGFQHCRDGLVFIGDIVTVYLLSHPHVGELCINIDAGKSSVLKKDVSPLPEGYLDMSLTRVRICYLLSAYQTSTHCGRELLMCRNTRDSSMLHMGI